MLLTIVIASIPMFMPIMIGIKFCFMYCFIFNWLLVDKKAHVHNTVFGHVVVFLVIVSSFRSASFLAVDRPAFVQPPHAQIPRLGENLKLDSINVDS